MTIPFVAVNRHKIAVLLFYVAAPASVPCGGCRWSITRGSDFLSRCCYPARVLFSLGVNRVLAAEAAVLVHLKTVGSILFVFNRVVVSLLAVITSKSDSNSHFRQPPYKFGQFDLYASLYRLHGANIHTKKRLSTGRYCKYTI